MASSEHQDHEGSSSRISKSIIKHILHDELIDHNSSGASSQHDYLQMGQDVLCATILEKSSKVERGRIADYVEETVPSYTDPMFRSHFRMNRTSVNELMNIIGPKFESIRSVSLESRTLACIWFLGNTETFRSVADRFDMSKGTLHFILGQFNTVFKDHEMLKSLISWPTTDDQRNMLSESFAERAGFPNEVGAIDGTYVPISGPSAFRESYICRKGFPAMHLQAVCGPDLRFLDVFCGYPGSVHDARVYRNSPLFQEVQVLPPKFHILGDSAYPMSINLMTPYRDNGHLTLEEKKYNSAHSSTRVDIERAFGLLKGKFRKLKFLDMRNVEDIPCTIVTCCALHNFILMNESLDESEVVLEDVDVDERIESENVQCENEAREVITGQEKRRSIMHLLM